MTIRSNCPRAVWRLAAVLSIAIGILCSACMWGYVRDASTDAAIPNATVRYTDSEGGSRTTTTNPSGLYVFDQETGAAPAAGPIAVEVSAAGYGTATQPGLVQYNDNSKATLSNFSSFWEILNLTLVSATTSTPRQASLKSCIGWLSGRSATGEQDCRNIWASYPDEDLAECLGWLAGFSGSATTGDAACVRFAQYESDPYLADCILGLAGHSYWGSTSCRLYWEG